MEHYTYLIVGAGLAGAAAVDGIRKVDKAGSIGLFGSEPHPPYNRPLLSKGLWKDKPYDKVWRKLRPEGVALHLGETVARIDPATRQVTTREGTVYQYEKLLLATGGEPRRLPFGGDLPLYYRTLDDYHALRGQTGQDRTFAVIGGGFIGSEIAAALATNGEKVTMVFPEETIGARIFPPDLARFVNDYFLEKGIHVLTGEMLTGIEAVGGQVQLSTASGKQILASRVVAGLGLRPNTALAEAAGLKTGDGVIVDECLQTSAAHIYAAGDVANFYSLALERRMRVEHEDNAYAQGMLAGKNMALSQLGQPGQPYHHLPFFYSDLFDLGYEAVGELNPALEIVADWAEPYRKGVIYYLKEGRVRGVLLWNVWGQLNAARQLISEPGPFEAQSLLGRLPEAA